MKRHLLSAAVALLSLPMLGAGQEPASVPESTPAPRNVEARAEAELRRMGDFLAKLPRFAFEAEETFDELPDGELRRQLTNVRRAVIERPNRLAADATGDTKQRAFWYDGKTATVLDKERHVYATIAAPATIDETLDVLADEYGIELPLVDLLYADPYAALSQGITYGRYLGLHLAAGVPCHHLAFSQATIEWQIWIDAGEQPLPRKMVITYVQEPGEPQYVVTFPRWRTDGVVPEGLFTFEAPEGATKVEPQRRPAEATGGGR